MRQLPQFDALYVISDLHLGGKEGFQIFRQPARLAGFISWLAGGAAPDTRGDAPSILGDETPSDVQRERPSLDQNVALVLNGDVVDFLAEDNPEYLCVHSGVAKLTDIVGCMSPFRRSLLRISTHPRADSIRFSF